MLGHILCCVDFFGLNLVVPEILFENDFEKKRGKKKQNKQCLTLSRIQHGGPKPRAPQPNIPRSPALSFGPAFGPSAHILPTPPLFD